MYIVISIVILILCVLLSLVVLVQNPKGGGLSQSLGGVSSQVFGAKNSAGLVENVTWY
jgi:preprotein translocase subunit SecG